MGNSVIILLILVIQHTLTPRVFSSLIMKFYNAALNVCLKIISNLTYIGERERERERERVCVTIHQTSDFQYKSINFVNDTVICVAGKMNKCFNKDKSFD